MLTFSPETGLVTPSTADIRAEVTAMFVSAFTKNGLPALNTEPETPAGQLIDSLTAIIADKNAEILYLANQFNPLVAEGQWQAAIGQIYFLTPKTATNSVADCVCNGLQGTVIGAGSVIQSSVDNTRWVALETKTIPSGGNVTISFQCQTEGEISAGAGTLDKIVTVTPGWDSVSNPASAVVGTLAETQRAFEARRYNSVAINARGSVAALYSALASIDGVLDVAVLENNADDAVEKNGVTIPAHSIWISIVGGTETDIAYAIYRNKDAGCGTAGNTTISYTDNELSLAPTYNYYIERPSELPFGVKVTIRETDATPADIDELVKAAVTKNFLGNSSFPRAGTAQVIYSSRFYNDVITAGANDLISIEIATYRSVVCTCTGTAGTVIPKGSVIQSTADNTQWLTSAAIAIPDGGSVDAVFVCKTIASGAAASGTLTQIVSSVDGWTGVTNATASTTGNGYVTQIEVDADQEPVIDADNITVVRVSE